MNRKKLIRIGIVASYVLILFGIATSFWILGSKIKTRKVPEGSIEVSTSYSTYLLGENVDFTVKNNFNSAVTIENNCPSEPLDVYFYENSKWVRVHDEATNKNCSKDQRQIVIPAKGQQTASFANWPNLFKKPGKYRIVVYVQYFNQLPYHDFEIIERPIVPVIPAVIPKPTPIATASTQSTNATSSNTTSTQQVTKSETRSYTQGNITVTYSSTSIVSVTVQDQNGWSHEMNSGATSREITFQKPGNQEVVITVRLRNGTISFIRD